MFQILSRRHHNTFKQALRDSSRCLSTNVQQPSEADCVIIGGGSIGCSILYHLTKNGMKNCVLLERDRLTSGTTWHTAGLLWNLRPNDQDIPLLKYTRKLISEILPEETGDDAGWINNGGLFIATTAERMDEYKRLHTLGKCYDVDSHLLTPAETKALYPLLNVDDVYGSLYSPSDGLIDPAQWTSALVKMGKKRGGKVLENTSVESIETEKCAVTGYTKITGVTTSNGLIKTPLVVNACGAWGPKAAEMVGLYAPTMAYRHAYAVTEGIDGIRNMPNVRDHDGAFYLRLQGEALQVGGYEQNPQICGESGELPDDFSFGLYDIDWENNFFHIINAAVNRLPALETTGIKSEICGPLSFTADDRPICGYAPGFKGYFFACGFDLGMMFGGAAGDQLAQWIVRGRPTTHLYGWDCRRFNPRVSNSGNQEWLRERTHERFATMYKAVYPKDEPLAGRMQLTTPFHEEHEKNGVFYQERHGWERAGWFHPEKKLQTPGPYQWYGANGSKQPDAYEDAVELDYKFGFPKHFPIIAEEARACRENVVGFDMSYFGKFYMSGPDAPAAADWIFSNDVRRQPGTSIYTCMLNNHGGVEADLACTIVNSGTGTACDPVFGADSQETGYYITAGGGSAYHDWVHIEEACRDKGFQNVTLEDRTMDMGIMSIQGPYSRELLSRLAPDIGLSNERFPFATTQTGHVAGHWCRLIRLSFVGEMGWELHIPRDSCLPVFQAIQHHGQEFGFRPAGYRALEPLAAEKGFRFWDSDLQISDTPLEAALGFTCKMGTDVDFMGRQTVQKQKETGIRRRIVCFTLDQQIMLNGLESIFRDGEPVGFLRRGEYAFTMGKPIGYGYVERKDGKKVTLDWIRKGHYELESLGVKYEAQAHTSSPFDPKHRRLQGNYGHEDEGALKRQAL